METRHDQVQDHRRRDCCSHARHLAHRLQRPGASPSLGPSRGWGIGAGFVAGTLIGAAVASNAYYDGYAECHYVKRFDRWGNYIRTVKVCDVVPY